MVLDESHVGLAVLNNLKAEMKQLHTVLWADDHIPVEFGYQSLTMGVRGILRKSWPAGVPSGRHFTWPTFPSVVGDTTASAQCRRRVRLRDAGRGASAEPGMESCYRDASVPDVR